MSEAAFDPKPQETPTAIITEARPDETATPPIPEASPSPEITAIFTNEAGTAISGLRRIIIQARITRGERTITSLESWDKVDQAAIKEPHQRTSASESKPVTYMERRIATHRQRQFRKLKAKQYALEPIRASHGGTIGTADYIKALRAKNFSPKSFRLEPSSVFGTSEHQQAWKEENTKAGRNIHTRAERRAYKQATRSHKKLSHGGILTRTIGKSLGIQGGIERLKTTLRVGEDEVNEKVAADNHNTYRRRRIENTHKRVADLKKSLEIVETQTSTAKTQKQALKAQLRSVQEFNAQYLSKLGPIEPDKVLLDTSSPLLVGISGVRSRINEARAKMANDRMMALQEKATQTSDEAEKQRLAIQATTHRRRLAGFTRRGKEQREKQDELRSKIGLVDVSGWLSTSPSQVAADVGIIVPNERELPSDELHDKKTGEKDDSPNKSDDLKEELERLNNYRPNPDEEILNQFKEDLKLREPGSLEYKLIEKSIQDIEKDLKDRGEQRPSPDESSIEKIEDPTIKSEGATLKIGDEEKEVDQVASNLLGDEWLKIARGLSKLGEKPMRAKDMPKNPSQLNSEYLLNVFQEDLKHSKPGTMEYESKLKRVQSLEDELKDDGNKQLPSHKQPDNKEVQPKPRLSEREQTESKLSMYRKALVEAKPSTPGYERVQKIISTLEEKLKNDGTSS